jgi:hypothetical protein
LLKRSRQIFANQSHDGLPILQQHISHGLSKATAFATNRASFHVIGCLQGALESERGNARDPRSLFKNALVFTVVWLMPENPDFEPIRVDLRKQSLTIEGVVVGVLRRGRSDAMQ